jgi:hypothetical protein
MAITFQNSTGGTIATGASTWSLAMQTGLTAGGALIVGIGCNTGVTVNAVTDNIGNTYSSCVRANGPSTSSAELWFTNGISTLSTRVSITLSGASSGSIAIGHWTGLSTNGAFRGVTGSSAINSGSTSHSASEVAVSSNGLAVSFCRMTASTIGTISTLGGMVPWISTNVAARTFGMYLINGANASTATGSFTTSSNCQHAAVIAVFSDTSAGGMLYHHRRMLCGIGR